MFWYIYNDTAAVAFEVLHQKAGLFNKRPVSAYQTPRLNSYKGDEINKRAFHVSSNYTRTIPTGGHLQQWPNFFTTSQSGKVSIIFGHKPYHSLRHRQLAGSILVGFF